MSDLPEGFQPEEAPIPEGFLADEDVLRAGIEIPQQVTSRLTRTLEAGAPGSEMGREQAALARTADPLGLSFPGLGPAPATQAPLVGPESLTEPFIKIPSVSSTDPRFQAFLTGATGQVPTEETASSAAAALNVAKSLPEFAETGVGVLTGPLGYAEPAAAKLIGAGFAGQMIPEVPEAARQAGRLSVEGTPQERKEAYLGLGSNIVLPALLGAPALEEAGRALRRVPAPAPVPPVAPITRPAPVSEVRTVEPPAPPVTPSPTVQPLPAETGAPAPVPEEAPAVQAQMMEARQKSAARLQEEAGLSTEQANQLLDAKDPKKLLRQWAEEKGVFLSESDIQNAADLVKALQPPDITPAGLAILGSIRETGMPTGTAKLPEGARARLQGRVRRAREEGVLTPPESAPALPQSARARLQARVSRAREEGVLSPPEVASLGPATAGGKDPFGNPLGTKYHATPEDWAKWKTVQEQAATAKAAKDFTAMAVIGKETEALKAKYAGALPQSPKLAPDDLQPALLVDNKPVTGGDTHEEIFRNATAKETNPDVIADIIDAQNDDARHVFVDKTGNVYTRKEAAVSLGEKDPLKSERLLELKKKAAPTPAATPAAAPAPAAPTYTGVDAQVVAGKPLGEWFTVKDAKDLPKGEARALLARTIGVANQPAKILSALKSSQERIRKRVGEIYAPPAPEVAPVTPAAPEAAPAAGEVKFVKTPSVTKGGKPFFWNLYLGDRQLRVAWNRAKKVWQVTDAQKGDTLISEHTNEQQAKDAAEREIKTPKAAAPPPPPPAPAPAPEKFPNTGIGAPADAFGAIYGPKLTPDQISRFKDQEGEQFDIPSEGGFTTTLKVKRNMLWMETSQKVPGTTSTYDVGVAYMHIRPDGTTVLDASKHGRPIDKAAAASLMRFLQRTGEKEATPTPPAALPPTTPAPAAPAVKLSESDMRDLVSDLTQLSRRSDLDAEERANVARAIEAARMGNPTEGLALRDRLKELAVPKTKLVKGIKFGGTGERIPDLIDWLKDAFPSGVKITSKSDYGRLVDEATGAAREVLFKNKGASVDTVMKAAELEGMHFASQDDFINAVLKAGSGRTETGARLSAEERMLQEEAAQVEEFQATALRNRGRTPAEKKAAKPFAVENLKQGDIFSIKGEQFKVREVTPEGDVITDDGKRFGQQQLRDGQTIYPDKGEVIETSEEGPGPIGMGGAAEGEIKPTGPRGEELPTYGVAARVLEKQRQAGTIIPVEPGEGVSPEEQIQRGRDLLAAGANAENIMAEMERTKKFNADEAAILRAHGELLDQAFFAASDKFGPNSPVAEKALEDYSAWQKRFKNLSTEWHRTGQTLQGETEIDTGTFHGLRKAWIDATGKDFTPEQAQEAKKKAKAVKDATEEADKAKADTLAEVGKSAATETGKRPAAPKPGEVAVPDAPTIWKRAKELLDAGEDDFESLRHKLAQEFGIPVEEVYRKLTEPKAVRTISDDMYRKMANRRRLVNDAKDWLRNEQSPGWLQFIRKVPRVFFTAKILGHGTVGMITHAGLNIFNPGAWRTYWPNFFRQYRLLASKAYHERTMQDLLRDPLFTKARRAGLANDPFRVSDDYQNPTFVKWLDRIGLTGGRGFDALKTFRQARFNQIWNSLPESLQTPGYAKLLADGINHATGAIRRPFREWANWTFFAPRLEASRWAWMVKDSRDAAKTFVDWEKATPEARAFAMSQLKEKAAIAGTYYGLLMMNQGLLEASGSDQRINFTNPRRGDFLAFKAAGHNIGIVGPMLGMVRLFANLYHAAAGKRGKVESLTPRAAEFGQIAFEYARGKLSPFAGFGTDVISQADFQGRPMPYSTDKTPKYLRRQGLGPYTYTEYALQGFTPIPFSEAVREVWRDQGMGDEQIEAWRKALLVGVAAGLTGARVSAESPPSPTK